MGVDFVPMRAIDGNNTMMFANDGKRTFLKVEGGAAPVIITTFPDPYGTGPIQYPYTIDANYTRRLGPFSAPVYNAVAGHMAIHVSEPANCKITAWKLEAELMDNQKALLVDLIGKRHRCMPDQDMFESWFCGSAIDVCEEAGDDRTEVLWPAEFAGQFWVYNDEYYTRVNYCPFCGAKAPQQVGWEPPVNA